ncbi:hypothetical protein M0R19_04520 [Candidatus Pacearchaeota archaeon]|jgi:hypothetical protein|nr:hypothetical protein [Candidatus Pacearchaeota archaeon]
MSNPSTSTYQNLIVEEEISLAVEQFFIAPEGTAYTPGRVNASSPPSGFVALGAVVEESPTVNITRSLYQLSTGVPKTLQYQKVMEFGAAITATLFSFDPKKVQYALGNVDPTNVIETTCVSLASVTDKETITLSGSPATAWAVGDYIATASSTTGVVTTSNLARISSINGLTIVFSSYTFDNTPASHDYVSKVSVTMLPFGTSQLKKYVLLGVADMIDGPQAQHFFKKVSPAGDWSHSLKAEASQMPINFTAYATASTSYTGSSENIVGEYFVIRP